MKRKGENMRVSKRRRHLNVQKKIEDRLTGVRAAKFYYYRNRRGRKKVVVEATLVLVRKKENEAVAGVEEDEWKRRDRCDASLNAAKEGDMQALQRKDKGMKWKGGEERTGREEIKRKTAV
jgi:hypothetical protein